ncbi:MAG: hypothetical protein RMY16_14715 [Nostoc sp. DedQUE12b]|uniref:hypothetical protein n=1 Tax=unclassified Nostoc TaxID=2593658 RepID=UPI002AD50F68|nr:MULTISPECIES: hypothetical protein [unclassified Nostoc]MDZ7953267.1 hypothetical protein [Nostoc sp. DedQUE09]MDZ8086790.1 hypothetical protein [Nostoc sp. DedQUE12b]
MKNLEKLEIHLRPRATETVSIKIPTDTLRSLEKVADNRDISLQALLKLSKSRQL